MTEEHICEAHTKYDQEYLNELDAKVDAHLQSIIDEEKWMTNTVITPDGKSVALYVDEEDPIIDELWEIAQGDTALMEYITSYVVRTNRTDEFRFSKERKERLGWEPGMAMGTPDVPAEKVAEIVEKFKDFQCPCDTIVEDEYDMVDGLVTSFGSGEDND